MTYYGNFAKGGSAAIHMGEVIMDRKNSLAHEDHMNLIDENTLQTLNTFNEYAHIFGAKTSVELNHSGQFAMPQFGDGSDPMGPVEMNMPSGTHVRMMNEDDMAYVAKIYAKAANMAKRGGCDMVCMHYGHGWLMGAFLSPLVNTRTDQYGGSLENRMRFPRMVLEEVRKAVGKDFLIEVRISGDEYTPGGIVIEDAIEYVKMIEDLADLVHFSAGNRLFPETRAIMQEWQAAIESGTSYGWRSVSVYPSDHVTTDDGTDVPPTSASDDLGENGEYMEMRDFESPLPAELRNLDQITLNCALYYHDTVYYFDGHNFYRSSVARQNVGTIRAVVQRDPGMLRRFTGSAELNGVPTTLTAEVSPLAAVLTLNGTGTLADLMPALAGTDADTWLELSLSDETGRTYLPRDGFGPDAALPLTFSLDGSGALPESLTARLTVLSEGTDDSAAPSVEIALTVIQ